MVAVRRGSGQAGVMDLEAAAEVLYAADPDRFVPARTALVAQARAAKDRPLAVAIGSLKKPMRSAWLVNLLAHDAPDELTGLSELASKVAQAHQRVDLAELRQVGGERQRLIDDLTRRAVAAGSGRGYTATEAVRSEVHGTLASAVADPAVLDEVLAGRVLRAQVYSGFGFPLGAMPQPVVSAPVPAAAVEPVSVPDDGAEARRLAAQAMTEATDRLIEARGALKQAEAAEVDNREQLDRASQEVADLRAELRRAEQAEEQSRRSATQAADDVHDARTAVGQAEQALAQAARTLGAPPVRAP